MIAQSDSEHSRHHFFGNLIVDNELIDFTLFKSVKAPMKFKKINERKDNSLIAFKDNSSVIRGSKSNQFTFKYP